jgi:single-strand DNA-binding protein
MARGINRVTLIGNLGKDPELKTFPNGGSVCNVSLATSETWKGKDGQPGEHTEWHNLVFNDKLAEIANQYLRKGSKVYVEGQIRTRKYQDKEGKDRFITEIRVRDMQMLDGKPGEGETSSRRERNAPSRETADNFQDDDIPF